MNHIAGAGPPLGDDPPREQAFLALRSARPTPAAEVTAGFDLLYTTNFERLVLQLYAYTSDMDQARDMVQEAFARALARWSRLATYDDPVAWVRRVAWNLATSRWRQARRFQLFARGQRPQVVPEPSPDRVAINAALATLPRSQRRIVIMYYLADLPISEIAQQEGVAIGTVKSWLHRARASLAAQLGDACEENYHA